MSETTAATIANDGLRPPSRLEASGPEAPRPHKRPLDSKAKAGLTPPRVRFTDPWA